MARRRFGNDTDALFSVLGQVELAQKVNSLVGNFNKGPRKRILRKGARIVVREARKTEAFKDRVGTLRKSLNIIPRLNKSLDIFVGPQKGTDKRYDGYYAQMVFGSALEFSKRVLDPAAEKSQVEVIQILKKEAEREIRKEAQKLNLR